MSAKKWVYRFGGGVSEGNAEMAPLLGNKGANLAEMAELGLPVPPGFILSTEVCRDFLDHGHELRREIRDQVVAALKWLDGVTGKQFGQPTSPLLVSVRSGAHISMPGMMDTVLNLGLNDETAAALAEISGNGRFIYDCYRRLVQMYGYVVLGVDANLFEDILLDFRNYNGFGDETEINQAGLMDIVSKYQSAVARETGEAYPQDIDDQFYATVGAVFHSWYSPRAISYRAMHDISDEAGTAVTVQSMVFGNMSPQSASGVAFTRNPSSGVPGLYGEYLPQAQGEDIVAGFRLPRSITEKGRLRRRDTAPSLQTGMPQQFEELKEVGKRLEVRFKDMQDIEFTIEEGRLWLLQTRTGKRTTEAAIRIALDLMDEGVIEAEEALSRVPFEEFERLVRPVIDPDHTAEELVRGLPASPGAASGIVVFNKMDAVKLAARGQAIVLVRNETSPEDVEGMNAAVALLTRRGGMTSHAAVIARAMGRPCVVGASAILIESELDRIRINDKFVHKGDEITIDGTGGRVFLGSVPMKAPEMSEYARRFKELAKR